MDTETLARSEVRKVGCPACGTDPLMCCRGVRGRERESNHRERVEAAVAEREAARKRRPKRYTRED